MHVIRPRRSSLTLVLCAVVVWAGLGIAPRAQSAVVPGASWERVTSVDAAGWSSTGLKAARDYSTTIKTAAVMVVQGGHVIDEWGETSRHYNIHSIRKSLLSALYGIHVYDGRIDLTRTLRGLGINDNAPSLSDVELGATLHDVIKARSGVYHPALYETAAMAAARPPRGSHAPGTFWSYNNWDFNVAGFIFERLTKTNLFRDFEERIARPIGMEDFGLTDTAYVGGADSVYPAYPFRLTARDMARFGLLFLRNGAWGWRRDRAGAVGEGVGDELLRFRRGRRLRLHVVGRRRRQAPSRRNASRRRLLGARGRRALHPRHPATRPGHRPPREHRHSRTVGVGPGIRAAGATDSRRATLTPVSAGVRGSACRQGR